MKKQIQTKHIRNVDMILCAAEAHRAMVRGEWGYSGWPDVPPKVLGEKFRRLADRGVFLDAGGLLSTTENWALPGAEKAEILAAMAAAGHQFDDHGWLVSRPDDIAEGERRAKEAEAEWYRLRTCEPATAADFIGKAAVLAVDAYMADFHAYVMTGKPMEQA